MYPPIAPALWIAVGRRFVAGAVWLFALRAFVSGLESDGGNHRARVLRGEVDLTGRALGFSQAARPKKRPVRRGTFARR
jgi:hypothetical protein